MHGPPVVTDIAGPISGPLCVVYRTERATRQDAGAAGRPAEPLLDRAGRPLVLTYGFICRRSHVVAPHDHDLRVARTAAVATYRRFHAGEEMFPMETSRPYSVQSTVAPHAAGPTASRSAAPAQPAPSWPAASRSPAPWTVQILPGSQRPPPVRRRPAVLISLLAVLALAGLTGAYVVTHGRQTEVPNVVGKDKTTAVRQIQLANLVPQIEFAANQLPSGTVLRTWPAAGRRVARHSVVQVEVSRGSSPASMRTPSPEPPGGWFAALLITNRRCSMCRASPVAAVSWPRRHQRRPPVAPRPGAPRPLPRPPAPQPVIPGR